MRDESGRRHLRSAWSVAMRIAELAELHARALRECAQPFQGSCETRSPAPGSLHRGNDVAAVARFHAPTGQSREAIAKRT